jgi:hypothetical protein
MAKKQERIPVTGQFGRGADAFFGSVTEEEENTGRPAEQKTVKPVEQRNSVLVNQDASKTVNQDTSRRVSQIADKVEFMKATYYITPEQDMKLERVRLARRQQGVKVDKSALIREAIDYLPE